MYCKYKLCTPIFAFYCFFSKEPSLGVQLQSNGLSGHHSLWNTIFSSPDSPQSWILAISDTFIKPWGTL